MASYKAVAWTYCRWLIASAWLATLVRVSIPDYGYQYSLFVNLGYDPTGWLHECFYISVFFVCLITLTYYWQSLGRDRDVRVFVVRSNGLAEDTQRKRERV